MEGEVVEGEDGDITEACPDLVFYIVPGGGVRLYGCMVK